MATISSQKVYAALISECYSVPLRIPQVQMVSGQVAQHGDKAGELDDQQYILCVDLADSDGSGQYQNAFFSVQG